MEQREEAPWGVAPQTWKISTVKDEALLVTDYVANGSFASLAQNVEYKSEEDYAVLVRLVDYNNDFQGPFVFIDENAYEFLAKSKLYGDEIIISNVGTNVGTVFKCPRLKWKMSLAPNAIMVKFKGINDFYYYWFKSKYGQHMLSSIVAGSAQPKFNKTNFRDLAIPVPPINEQKQIASVLSSLDDKIELNRRINDNLEALAKQLYDYWFVQFDFPNEEDRPYKSSGGKMVWNEKLKRNIPIGWHCGNLFEIAVFTNGLACQKFRPKDGEGALPVIKIREMHDGISVDSEEVTSKIPESVKVYNGDVLFSWSASLEVMLWPYGLGGLNQHIFKVTSANDFPKSFYYFQLLDYVNVFKKMAEARRTTMGHITQDHLQQSTIAIPNDKDIADRFEKLISPIFAQIVKLQQEISNLTKKRDELLPLLMNAQTST